MGSHPTRAPNAGRVVKIVFRPVEILQLRRCTAENLCPSAMMPASLTVRWRTDTHDDTFAKWMKLQYSGRPLVDSSTPNFIRIGAGVGCGLEPQN